MRWQQTSMHVMRIEINRVKSKNDNFSTGINRGGEHIRPYCQWSAEAINPYILPILTFRLSINVSLSIQHFYLITNLLLNESKENVNIVTD